MRRTVSLAMYTEGCHVCMHAHAGFSVQQAGLKLVLRMTAFMIYLLKF